MIVNFKQNPINCPKHLAFIRTLPCIIRGTVGEVQAAHIRSGGDGGLARKPSDSRVVPLHWYEHKIQHNIGEKEFFGERLQEVIHLAELLYQNTGNRQKCIEIINLFRMKLLVDYV
jgi:hypothetical protein